MSIELNLGSGGKTLAADATAISGEEVQEIKLILGDDGTSDGAVSSANPLPVSLDDTALAATVHAITAKLATDKIQNDTTECTPKFATINVATAADHEVVAAVTGKKIRVLSLFLSTDATGGNARFEDGAGGTALTGIHELVEELRSITLPFNPVGWFETSASPALSLEWSAAQNCDGFLTYIEV